MRESKFTAPPRYETTPNYRMALVVRSVFDALMSGESPRLIDEWQVYPPFWDAVRYQSDMRYFTDASIKMVLTAVGEFAYTRPDGVIVCPLSALRP